MPNLFTREDTLLGVCEGLGQELGVPALALRVGFALALFWNPLAVVATYLALGVVLMLFRWAFPFGRRAAATPPAVPAVPQGDNDDALPARELAA
jgi:phage shock protein C